MTTIKHIGRREEELMNIFWEHGPLFVKEIVKLYDDPVPHVNTISTFVRSLEAKGYLDHKSFGGSYQYYPIISKEDFSRFSIHKIVTKYFDNSFSRAISALVREEDISIKELKALIKQVQKEKQ